jgi:hypothetical protein
MNINGTDSMQQIQMQTQMRKMDGSGNGQGKGGGNGMKDIMQGLEPTDRVTLQEQLSSISSEDRSSIQDQLKAVDGTDLNSNEYLQSLLAAMNTQENSTESFTPVYA